MKRAFTLIELVMAISLSSIIFMLAGSLMAFMINYNSQDLRQETFEQAKNDISEALTNAVRWGKTIKYLDDEYINVDGVQFEFNGGNITKDGQDLITNDVVIDSFKVQNYSNNKNQVSLEIKIAMHNRSFSLARDTLKVVVSQRKTEITL